MTYNPFKNIIPPDDSAKAELERKRKIREAMDSFTLNVNQAIATSDLSNIDERISTLEKVTISQAIYQEFTLEMSDVLKGLQFKFKERKTDLLRIAQLEKENSEKQNELKSLQAKEQESNRKGEHSEALSLKVEGVTVRNFKGVKDEKLSCHGNNVYVIGRNGMGKTSFLDAIFKILSGKDLPSQPTAKGEKKGSVEIDLGKIIVKAKFNDKNEKVSVSVENKEGLEYKSPRTMLDELVGVIDFDINKFLSLTPNKQVDFIKSMAGIDFTDLDATYKEAFENRAFVNKKIKEIEPTLQKHDEDKLVLADLTVETTSIQKKRDHNKNVEQVEYDISLLVRDSQLAQQQIEELTKKIEELKKVNTEINTKITNGNEWLKYPENAKFDLEKEEADFVAKIEGNKLVEKNIANKAKAEEYYKLIDQQTQYQKVLDSVVLSKQKAIEEAELPVPGLGFNEDGLTLDGLPFESAQVNTARKIIAGLQINLKLLGNVKIARFDGSLIDNENMEYIEEWAKKNDLQLFVEFVDRSAERLKIEVKEV